MHSCAHFRLCHYHCQFIWIICNLNSKHLKGQLGPCVGDVTFFWSCRSVGTPFWWRNENHGFYGFWLVSARPCHQLWPSSLKCLLVVYIHNRPPIFYLKGFPTTPSPRQNCIWTAFPLRPIVGMDQIKMFCSEKSTPSRSFGSFLAKLICFHW